MTPKEKLTTRLEDDDLNQDDYEIIDIIRRQIVLAH
jgi:uncharacterized membrane protein